MVRVEGVKKAYGRHVVLQETHLTVTKGEVFALLGPNGAGKSTLLKAMVGLVLPDRGEILVDGRSVQKERRKALSCLGFVPQRVGFTRHMRVSQVLAYHARLKGVDQRGIDKAIARVGLEDSRDRVIGELSGGTLQRLGLAQALLASPPLLILDEPTVGLDPQVSAEFRELLLTLHREGVTVILTSHLLGEVERLATRVAILRDGVIRVEDTVANLLAASGPAELWVRPEGDPARAIAALAPLGVACVQAGDSLRVDVPAEGGLVVLDALRAAGVGVAAFWTTPPTLEAIFRRVVSEVPPP